jgi:hypothetical protein
MQSTTQTGEQSNARGITLTQNTASESTKDVVVETRPTVSTPISGESFEAISHSTNLIDDSIKHLHGLLKSIRVEADDFNVRHSPQLVNAACNCAKQIGGLIRLQTDMFRELRKAQPRQ